MVQTSNAHITESIAALSEELESAARAQCVMVAGTGVGSVLAGTAEKALESGSTRIFGYAQSNERLIENARMLRAALGPDVPIRLVTSEMISEGNTHTLADVEETRAQMDALEGRPAVFLATYDSAKVLSDAQRRADGSRMAADLGLVDQAHWTAGKSADAPYAHVLDDANVSIARRAFFTSTPRGDDANIARADALSMSDGRVYGRRVVDLTFARAREKDLVADYDIWVAVVSEDEVMARSAMAPLSTDERHAVIGDLALQRVLDQTGHKRVLTYHNSVSEARAFSGHASAGGLPTAHVDHASTPAERQQAMGLLRGEGGILSNIDVIRDDANFPQLEAVAFLGKTESTPRTIQAVSQAIRKDPENTGKRAAVIVPVVLDDMSEDALHRATKEQGFQTLVDVARAMRLADDTLDGDLRQLGRLMARDGDGQFARLKVAGLEGVGEGTRSAIEAGLRVAMVQQVTEPFDTRRNQLEAFVEEHGRLPDLNDDEVLASFVTKARLDHASGRMPKEHAFALDEMAGWSWIDPKAKGRTIARHLAQYAARRGDVPPYRIAPGPGTGAEDLGNFMYDAEKARLDVRKDVTFHAGSRRKAESIAEGIEEHVSGSGDGRLLRQVPRTDLKTVRGILRQIETKHGQSHLEFETMEPRLPHFDSGIVRDGKGVVLRLDGLSEERDRELRGLLTASINGLRATVSLELTPVLGPNGEYLMDRAGVSRVAQRAPVRRPAEKTVAERQDRNTTSEGFFFYSGEGRKEQLMLRLTRRGNYLGSSDTLLVRGFDRNAELVRSVLPEKDYAVRMTFVSRERETGIPVAEIKAIDLSMVRRPPEPKFNMGFIYNRLQDRRIAGMWPYTLANIESGRIPDPSQPATNLNPAPDKVLASIGRVRSGIDGIQRLHAEGKVPEAYARKFDVLKDFAWVEPENVGGLLAPALRQIVQRHGQEVLTHPYTRLGTTALAATLRLADDVVARPQAYPRARGDLAAMKEDGTIHALQAYKKLKVRESNFGDHLVESFVEGTARG